MPVDSRTVQTSAVTRAATAGHDDRSQHRRSAAVYKLLAERDQLIVSGRTDVGVERLALHVTEDGTTPVDEQEQSVHILLEHPNGHTVRLEDEEGSSHKKKRKRDKLVKEKEIEGGFCKIQI